MENRTQGNSRAVLEDTEEEAAPLTTPELPEGGCLGPATVAPTTQSCRQRGPGDPGVLEPVAPCVLLPKQGPAGLEVSSMAICSPVRWGSPDQTESTVAQCPGS